MTMYNPEVRIYCDSCDELLRLELCHHKGTYLTPSQDEIEALDWSTFTDRLGHVEHTCPSCKEEQEK